MTVHRIDLRPDLRPSRKRHGPTPMLYKGVEIGAAHAPIYAAARYLLDNGLAESSDVIETYRGDTLCMSGIAGDLAKLTVHEGDRRLALAKYVPFAGAAVDPETGETLFPVQCTVSPFPAVLEAASDG